MAVVRRTIKPNEASAINQDGVSTDKEQADALAQHLIDHHSGGGVGTEPAIALPYYYDEVRGLYLSHQIFELIFHSSVTGSGSGGNAGFKNQYLDYIPGVKSSNIPHKVNGANYCMIGYDLYLGSQESGDIMYIQDRANNFANLYTVNLPTPVDNRFVNDLNVVVNIGSEICVYVGAGGIQTPSIKLHGRVIYDIGV